MYKFFIKKIFFDGWDNMLSLLVPNIFILAVITLFSFGAHYIIEYSVAAAYILLAIGFVCVVIGIFAFGSSAASIADYKVITVKDYFKQIPKVLKDGILFSLLLGLCFVLLFVAIPFYVNWGNTVGLLLAALVLWIVIMTFLALQWFLPIRSLMHNNFRKCLKKSFILFFDNPGFSLFLFLYDAVLTVLSLPVFFMIPSFAGVVLAQINGVRLRLYKYDWLEDHPNATKKQKKNIPWKELIEQDVENVGPRSIKNFIFPGRS